MREVEIGGHIVRVGLLVAPEGDVLSVSVRSRSAPHVVLDSAFLRTEGVPHAAAAELEAGVAYVADGNPLVNAARALLDAPLLGAFLAPAAPAAEEVPQISLAAPPAGGEEAASARPRRNSL